MDYGRYSNMVKLQWVTVFILQFVRKLKQQEINDKGTEILSADNLREAEILWIKSIQETAFSEEVQPLSAKQLVPNQLMNEHGLHFDEKGTIRCKERLKNSTIPIEAKNPIVIQLKHHITKILNQGSHETVKHNGIRETLNCIQERYWITWGWQAVKQVLQKCMTCKRLQDKPFCTPKMQHLPPFTFTSRFC